MEGSNKQRNCIPKEEDRPLVATESVESEPLKCIVDAGEERGVTVIDIPKQQKRIKQLAIQCQHERAILNAL